MFFPPIPMIRKNAIIKALLARGATTKETAVSFADAGIINPNGFKAITSRLLARGTIASADGTTFFVNTEKR